MRLLRGALALTTVAALTTSCGLPDSGTPQEIDPSNVPYHLLGTATAAASAPVQKSRTTTPRVYLLTATNRLVAVDTALAQSGLRPVLAAVLTQLGQGPTEAQRAAGLATALGPGVTLTLKQVRARTVVIRLDLGEQGPSANKLPLAIGQVVLTATSVRGVDRVQLVRDDGKPIEVPLPSGALTVEPLAREDYSSLVVSSSPSTSQGAPS